MSRPRILVVDDEPQIIRFMKPALDAGGFDTVTANSAAEGIRLAVNQSPDLIILDLGLPDKDGKEVILNVRAWSQVPIIVLSARDRETEKVASLDLGADDYVNKPFGIGELLARIRAALRHHHHEEAIPKIITIKTLTLDTAKHLVTKEGRSVHLTPKEFDLLYLLMRHHDKLLTHRQILSEVWGPAHLEDIQYLRVLIKQLRRKVEAEADVEQLITTEPGVGYRLNS